MLKNLRYISVLILDKIFKDKAYSNLVLKNYLEKYSLKDVDKKLVTEIVYGTIKYKLSIDNILNKFVKKIDEKDISVMILRSALYQLNYLDRVPKYAVLNESVEISKKLCKFKSSFVNGVLRNYLRNKDVIKNSKNTLEQEYSFVSWMVKLFKNQFPNDYIDIMKSLNGRAEVCYRINSYKISKEELFDKFQNLKFEIINDSRNAINIKNLSNVFEDEVYKKGFITVQDLSSQIVCEIMNPVENDFILDLCGAPGGKSTYLAELIKDNGKIISCDLHEHKINLISQNAKRLGLKSLELKLNDALVLNKSFVGCFDKVLLDAPCSGLGVIRKKPEIKWFKNQEDLEQIINIQRKMVEISSKYVKVGGILMYTTCTLNKNENENIVNEFLKNNENFVLEELNLDLFCGLKIKLNENMVTLLPSEFNDGFFISKLRRI